MTLIRKSRSRARALFGVCIAASMVGGGLGVIASSLAAGPAGATQNTTNVANCTYIPVTNGVLTVALPNGSVVASVNEPTGYPSSMGDILFAQAGEEVTVECVTTSLPTSIGGQPVQTTVVVETSPIGIVINQNGDSVYESSCGADAAALGPAACLSDGNAPSLLASAHFGASPGNDGNGNPITCPSADSCITFFMQATGDANFPFNPADSNAQCPPTAAQVNAGLTNCALAVFGTTNTTTGAGTSVNANLVTYASQATSYPTNPFPTPNVPTLALSPASGGAGATVNVSDAASTGYWWSDAMFSDGFNPADVTGNGEPILPSLTIPANNIVIDGVMPAASSSVEVSPAAYNVTVTGTCPVGTSGGSCNVTGSLVNPAISGSFVLPASIPGGMNVVSIFEPDNAFADGNIDPAHLPAGVTVGANPNTPDIYANAYYDSVVSITTTSLPAATAGTLYSTTLAASGGTSPYTWSSSGLPAWASLDASTGIISGTPGFGDVGTSPSFNVTVTDSTSPTPGTATSSFTITVHGVAAVLNVSPSSGNAGTGVTLTGYNWPPGPVSVTFTTACATCSGPDTATATADASGNLTGSITITAVSGTGTGEAVGSDPIVATSGASHASAPFTVNSATACSVPAAGACTLNQIIGTTVSGTSLYASESSGNVTLSPITLGLGTGTNNQQFENATGALGVVTISDDRGSLAGWTVTGQMETNFTNGTPSGNAIDNVIPADFLTWIPTLQLETPGMIPADNANTVMCPSATGSCQGPSGLPAASSDTNPTIVGGTLPAGFNGTDLGTGGVSVVPAEVYVGPTTVLNNKDANGVAKVLCEAPAGGGGGGFLCGAGLSLAVPPYVAAGTYSATMDIVVTGL